MLGLLEIDGSHGEGGGQILRTSLALSLVTNKPISVQRVRAGRARPGLLRQHLTALKAAAEISQAEVRGAELGSREVTFVPGAVKGGAYRFAVGSAGSATLVLQTVLPALLFAGESSSLTLEGGTHNPWAPPFDFVARTFLPQLAKMGARVAARIERHGFHPAGGGRMVFEVTPVRKLAPLTLHERGEAKVSAEALVSSLPSSIAERELRVIGDAFALPRATMAVRKLDAGPGNVVMIRIESEAITEIVTAFGEQGVSAEKVAENAAKEASRYLASNVPVGEHLADQLIVPLALAGGGSFRTLAPSSHLATQAELLPKLLSARVRITREADDAHRVDVEC